MTSGTRATDWNEYYRRPYKTASVTRKFTERALIAAMRRYGARSPDVIELGGANSCFWQAIDAAIQPRSYTAVDNNALGLEKLRERATSSKNLRAVEASIFELPPLNPADIVFSVGLVEHFDAARTAAAISAHFRLAKPGGVVIVTFPTPTWLYRVTRFASERLGLWLFHDERPFWFDDVAATFAEHGRVLEQRILWPLVLTQTIAVATARNGALAD
jgi:SAM-dependent methyltransferase